MEEKQTAKIADLSLLTKSSELNLNDRFPMVYQIPKTEYKAFYGVNVASLYRGIMLAMVEDGTVKSHFWGLTEPASSLGNNGDLYFQYNKELDAIIGFFAKYEGVWISF